MSFTLIIFGITSNLAQIKLIPALYDMEEKNLLPKNCSVVGVARSPKEKKEFENYIYSVLHQENIHHRHPIKKQVFESLCKRMHYLNGHVDDSALYKKLRKFRGSRIYYLATYPELYQDIFQNLQRFGLNREEGGFVRLMIEKPMGSDLRSAQDLNQLLLNYFSEDQIYRLDHYLGKETLQNILTFRFGNGIFEPLINKNFVDHIQIQALEDFGIGRRGGYYDSVGALKDVGQNHQLQMLVASTMDAPLKFTNEEVTKKRLKILKSLVPLPQHIVFGQYQGYKKEENVNLLSQTDTFYALKTYLKNERFKDVPIYIRAGKKLAQTVTEISIIFKNPLNRLFKHLQCGEEPNVLIYRMAPNESIVFKILTKVPEHELELQPEYMQYCYKKSLSEGHIFPDPYERLIMDVIKGDQTFFNDAEEVEAQWAFVDPLVKAQGKPSIYQPGSWGPKEAEKLLAIDGRSWLTPSMDFCQI